MGQKIVSLTRSVFATCHHGCKVVEVDVLNLSRHYRLNHNSKPPAKPAEISDDQARSFLSEAKLNRKVEQRRRLREKAQAELRKSGTTTLLTRSELALATQQATMQPPPVTSDSNLTLVIPQAMSHPPPVINSNDDSDSMDIDTDESNPESQNPQSNLLAIATELRLKVIPKCLTRKTPSPYNLLPHKTEEVDISVMQNNRTLRLETLDLSTECVVVRFHTHYRDLNSLHTTEAALARVPFLLLPSDLVEDQSLGTSIVSLDLSMHVSEVPLDENQAFQGPVTSAISGRRTTTETKIRTDTVRVFLFEYRSMRKLIHYMQRLNSWDSLKKLLVMFSSRSLSKAQQSIRDTILDTIRCSLSGRATVNIFGAPDHIDVPLLKQTIGGYEGDDIESHISYFLRLLKRATELYAESRYADAMYEIEIAAKFIHEGIGMKLYVEESPDEYKKVLLYTQHIANLIFTKSLVALCAQAKIDGNLPTIPDMVLVDGTLWYDDTVYTFPGHSQQFRADCHAAVASGLLYQFEAKRAGQVFQLVNMAISHLQLAIALGHPATPHLTRLLQQCDACPPGSVEGLANVFGCVTKPASTPFPEEGEQQDLRWHDLPLSRDGTYVYDLDNTRIAVWFGQHPKDVELEECDFWVDTIEMAFKAQIEDLLQAVADMEVCLPEKLAPREKNLTWDHFYQYGRAEAEKRLKERQQEKRRLREARLAKQRGQS